MQQKKRILICPLDWGLGHATRCIPIIRLLQQKNVEVIIAADNRPLALLKKEFPDLKSITFKGYAIEYPESGSMIFKMLVSIPSILRGIKKEHSELDKIIKKYKIDAVISDNRFGCWNKNVKSIFITHQLMIKTPFAEKTLYKKNIQYIRNYNECWIPDEEGNTNLSGDLAHKYPLPSNAFFVSALSRFESPKPISDFTYDVMAIISGPEPQRSIFEKNITKQLLQNGLKALLVKGIPEENVSENTNNYLEIRSHLNAVELQKAILQSKIIVARSGYSTIMDLARLGKKAIFIPTPGQTEQEYLAHLFKEKNIAYCESQSKFTLSIALKESEKYTGFQKQNWNQNKLEERIEHLLKQI